MSTTTYEIVCRNLVSRIKAYSENPISELFDASRRGVVQTDCLIEEIRRAEVRYERSFGYDRDRSEGFGT